MPTETLSLAPRRLLMILVVLVLLVGGVLGIRRMTHEEIFVRTARATQGDIVSSVPTNGKVEPVRLYQAHATAPGQVKQVLVHVGELVPANTLLLRLDTADAQTRVATAQAAIASAAATQHDVQQGGSQEERLTLNGDIARAQLQVSQGKQELAALEQLQARGSASANEITASRERLLSAQSTLTSLQARQTQRYAATDKARVAAQLSEGHASLNAAEDQLSNSILRAPFAGTVFSLPVKQYDYVSAGDELLQLADLTQMQVKAYFDEPEIGKLRLNDSVTITWEARPGKQWHGHIARVPTFVDTYGTRNVGACLITIDDASGDLLPNTNVTVRVTTQQIFHVLVIPRDALRTQGSQSFVYVLRDGALHQTPVRVGALNLQQVQIVDGLAPGDVVALNTTNNVDMKDGLAVQEAK